MSCSSGSRSKPCSFRLSLQIVDTKLLQIPSLLMWSWLDSGRFSLSFWFCSCMCSINSSNRWKSWGAEVTISAVLQVLYPNHVIWQYSSTCACFFYLESTTYLTKCYQQSNCWENWPINITYWMWQGIWRGCLQYVHFSCLRWDFSLLQVICWSHLKGSHGWQQNGNGLYSGSAIFRVPWPGYA